jgi:hypothetical protein
MGFRFRRSVRIAPGLRLNLAKTGASLSVGRPGATLNLREQGIKATVGLPGSGLSYSTRLSQSLRGAATLRTVVRVIVGFALVAAVLGFLAG